MECKLNKWKTRRDFLKLLQYREHSIKGSKIFREQTQFTKGLIERLGLEHELTGHTGCVNCLQWSPDGRHLASGSDDTKVIIWDPFRYKQLHTIPTNHIGNIFSVKVRVNFYKMFDDSESDFEDFVERVQQIIQRQYISGNEELPHFELTDEQFHKWYRFSKECVMNVILPLIDNNNVHNDNCGLLLAPLAQILIALCFYATGSMQFLGYDNIATGAGDCRVFVQSIPGALAKLPPLLECSCHVNRVKRLATSPIEPTFLWSAAEDGFVIQYDLREKHECSPNHTKILIDLSRYFGEVKCIAVNPTKPHYIAVGSNDCYVRMYDRRKLKTCLLRETYQMSENPQTPQEVIDPNCVQYYAPGHLSIDNYDSYSYRLSTTYISFNTAGTEMLANVGGEQIYLYDVNTTRSIKDMQVPQLINGVNRISNPIYNSCCRPEQTRSLDSFKYNELSDEFCACFYMNRAYTFYTRKWMGDLYQAARDYIYVTRHWPHEKQAYIGLIKTFTELKWTKEAQAWMNYFMKMNQDPTNFSQIQTLSNDITNPEFEISKEDREDILRRCGGKRVPSRSIDAAEQTKRLNSRDYEVRFIGHCNTTTDIKEVNFLGESGDYICAGSDEGIIFVWERKLGEVVTAVTGDISIVNCVQPHPTTCLIASSGIDRAVKLWSPQPEEFMNPRKVKDIGCVVEANQKRMALDPIINIAYSASGFEGAEALPYPLCRAC